MDANLELSILQKEVLVGTLLGDGHLYINPSRSKASLAILQSGKHKEYVFHLYEIFKEFVSTPPSFYTFGDKRAPGRVYERYSFRTRFFKCFMPYADLFFPKNDDICKKNEDYTIDLSEIDDATNKKRVPTTIADLLTARGIAYWYMDDGSAKWLNASQAMRLCTDSFSVKEIELLLYVLKEKFGIKCKMYSETPKATSKAVPKTKNRINLPASSYPRFNEIVAPYFLDSMLYKYPLPREQKFAPNKTKNKDLRRDDK